MDDANRRRGRIIRVGGGLDCGPVLACQPVPVCARIHGDPMERTQIALDRLKELPMTEGTRHVVEAAWQLLATGADRTPP